MQVPRYVARSAFASSLVIMATLCSCELSHPLPASVLPDAKFAPPLPAMDGGVAAERVLDVSLSPRREAGEVVRLAVTLRYAVPNGELGGTPPAFRVFQAEDGEKEVAEQIVDIHAQDAAGELTLSRSTLQEDGVALVQWQGNRQVRGPLSLSYWVRVAPAAPNKLRGMRSQSGGFFGLGLGVLPLLVDKSASPYRVRFHWDRSHLAAADVATSSFGLGDVEVTVPLERLASTLFMAGPLGRMAVDDGFHFEGTWLGKLAMEPLTALAWSARFYGFTRRFFRDPAPSTYTFFLGLQPPLYDSYRGSGHATGIIFRLGPEVQFNGTTRFLLAHELTHRWIGLGLRLGGPEGSAYWFTEGLTVYYTGRLLLRSGLGTAEEFLLDLNHRVERFSKSPVRTVTNEELTKYALETLDYEKLAYDRGLLYAAEVDAAVRVSSGGKRSLDDLMLALMAQGRSVQGGQIVWKELGATAFREAVGRELGAVGQTRYDAVILHGELPSPPSDAFGPCFRSVKKKYFAYELGLDLDILLKEKRAAQVRPGSAVARAGVKEGERIPDCTIHVGDADHPVKLSVERGGKIEIIKYFPRGAPVDGLGWERVKVDDAACAR